MFLLDGSDGVRSGFPLLKDFVQRVVEGLDVGQDRVRVAVVQYSDRTRPEFYLNSYRDQQSVVDAIRRLSPLGGPTPNTGAALTFVLRNVLTSSAGSRVTEGVPQLLIVLTADRSGDDVRGPSVVLKRGGAVPIGVGIGNADITEMQTISYIPDFAVAVPTFGQLGDVQQDISQRVTRLNRQELSTLRRNFTSSGGEEGAPGSLSLETSGGTCLDSGLQSVLNFLSSAVYGANRNSTSWELGLVFGARDGRGLGRC